MSYRRGARMIGVDLRSCGRLVRRMIVTASMSTLLVMIAIPPSLIPRAADAQTQQMEAERTPSPDFRDIEIAFQEEAVRLGLVPVGVAAVNDDGNGLRTIVLGATAPLGRPDAPAFFMKRTAAVAADAGGNVETLATSDVIVGYAEGHATVELVDRFSGRFDEAMGHAAGVSGMEIRRTAEVDIPELEALVSADGSAASRAELTELLQRGELEYGNYVEQVSVTDAEGNTQTFAARDFDLSQILGNGSGAGAIDCIRTCFSNAGGDIGLLTVVCIVSGAAVCAVGCAVTVGVACIPCILTVGGVCGVVIPTGGAAVCTAQCLFPDASLPTPTRPRTSTPTRTRTATATPRQVGCVGDCNEDGEVTVDEVLSAIGVALGTAPINRCTAVDTSRDGRVTVDEILSAMNFALNGCVFE